jgi:WD40 repeat protein
MIDFRDGKGFVVVGATTGQVIASQVGGIGVVGGFGGMALGTPVIVVGGAIAGAAVKAIIDGIETGDVTVLGVTTLGSVLGAGFSATIGNVGVGVAGSAFGVGLGTMAVTGGVFALGVYQLIKMFAKGQSKESVAQTFERMEDRISGQELYNQAMMELDPILGEIAWKQKMSYLEIEEELQELKATIQGNLTENNLEDYQWQNLETQTELENLKQQLNSYFQDDNFQTKVLYDSTRPDLEKSQIIAISQLNSTWQSTELNHFEVPIVNAVAIAPNNQYILSGNHNGTVHLWDLQTKELLFTFIGSREEVQAIAVTPDSNRVLAAGFDRRISTWHIEKKSISIAFFSLNSSYSHDGVIYALAVSPDGKWLASGSSDKKIKIWGRITGKWERTLNGHSSAILALVFSPDGQILISASEDKTIRLWNIKNPQALEILQGHSERITCLSLTANGEYLLSGSLDGKVNIWNLQDKTILKTINTDSGLLSLTINNQMKIFATANSQEVKLWDLETGELLETLAGCHPIVFSHDGVTLVSGSNSRKSLLKIWQQTFGDFENKGDGFNLDFSQAWWEILDVSPTSDPQEVKLAYYYLAKKFHPDQNNSQEAIKAMQIINSAYARFRKLSN